MNIGFDEAITRLAERQNDLSKDISQKNRQRRTGFVDLYGIEIQRSGNPAQFYISISPDLEYYERFQFKLFVQRFTGTRMDIYVDGVDITDYLIAQHDGEWITGPGLYPTDDISQGSDEPNDFYDILDVASVMADEDIDVTDLLNPGFKLVEITSDGDFTVSLILYLKYSHINR